MAEKYYADRLAAAVTSLSSRGEVQYRTSNKELHRKVVAELGFDLGNLPYGLRSAEVVRRARKAYEAAYISALL